MAKIIQGLAIIPRVSRNGVFYWPQELSKFHNKTVPLRFNHDQSPEGVIGRATFHYDPDKNQVTYIAEITDPKFQELIDNMSFQVSIGASVEKHGEICHPEGKGCFEAPVLSEPDELSIVETPGMPESTLNIVENTSTLTAANPQLFGTFNFPIHKLDCLEKPVIVREITSNKSKTKHLNIMAEENKVEEKVKVTIETDDGIEVSRKDKDEEKEAAHQDECPPGQHMVDGKCVKRESTTKEDCDCKKVHPDHEQEPVQVAPQVAPTQPNPEQITQKVEDKVTKTMESLLKEVRENWTPKSEVQEGTSDVEERDYTDEEAKEIFDKVMETGHARIQIDKENYIFKHTYGQTKDGHVSEALATSGTIPTVVADSQIVITRGSKTTTPVRQFGKFKAIPTGANTARFYRITVPDAGAITESPDTNITAITHTLTSLDVTAAIRGWRQSIEKAEFEDSPATLLNALRETARIEALRDEHRLIVQDLTATDHDFGGLTTTPFHIGADGLATTNTTEEDADPVFGPDGLTLGRRFLDEQNGVSLAGAYLAFLSPQAFEDLYTNTGLSEYTQIGNASLTRQGQMERIYGVDIIVTNELLQQNNADRNLLIVKGEAWALVSQRTMEIEFQKQIAGQYIDIVWTHRIGVDILDAAKYIIISSTTD